jgi:mannose/fructose/N-acetylgalactosamine-specific phosphotransferase system component IID
MRFRELCGLAYRSLYIQATFNLERMQALGFCNCLLPFARKNIQDQKARSEFLKRHLMFFNSHPYMVGWILGAVVNLEEKLLQDGDRQTDIDRYKRMFSQTISAVGDSLFWGSLKPVIAILCIMISLLDKVLGLVLLIVLFNIPHLYIRFSGIRAGYKSGLSAIKEVTLGRYSVFITRLTLLGGFFSGLLLGVMASSLHYFSVAEMTGFTAGAGMMFFCVRKRISIPMTLIGLSLFSFFVGFLIHMVRVSTG